MQASSRTKTLQEIKENLSSRDSLVNMFCYRYSFILVKYSYIHTYTKYKILKSC